MKISDVTQYMDQLAPRHYAEDFDNTGLLVGDQNNELNGILVSLDCLENVVEEAIDRNCNMIVCFHPIIFSGLKKLQPTDYVSRTVIKAIKNDISIYATHTALDNLKGGVSYRMAQEIGLEQVATLVPKTQLIKKMLTYIPSSHFDQVQEALFEAGAGQLGNYSECGFSTSGKGTFKGNEDSQPAVGQKLQRTEESELQLSITFLPHLEKKVLKALKSAHPYEEIAFEITTLDNQYQNIGMGAIGKLAESMKTEDFLAHIKKVFGTGVVRTSLLRKQEIKKVAVLGGSGAFAISNAIQSGADAYITADLKYHDFFRGEQLLLCDVGHYESEQFTKNLLHEHLSEKFSNFAVLCAKARTNPVNYF